MTNNLDIGPPSARPPRHGLPKAGDFIKHYELIRELGRGGMGTVFLARDTELGRRVVLKLLTKLSVRGAKRFYEEARITAQCKHENIVVLHDVGEHDGHPYMVLEYIEGPTLRAWMNKQRGVSEDEDKEAPMPPVPAAQAVELMIPAVRALSYVHKLKLVHRDLKPENVMLDDSGPIKVLDFGIAKDLAEDHHLTTKGSMLGTRTYMSPEQWHGDDVDGQSDLWAVGIMLYELVIGVHPLAPASWFDCAQVGDRDKPMPRVVDVRPDLSALGAIIDRCLRKHKTERMASAEELLAKLDALRPGQKPIKLPPGQSLPMRSRTPWIISEPLQVHERLDLPVRLTDFLIHERGRAG